MKNVVIIFICLWQTLLGSEALVWQKSHLEMKTDHLEETHKSEFIFENKSSEEITILEIKTTCNCIVVDFPRVIMPKSKSKISFSAKNPLPEDNFYGSIRINTDESQGFNYALTFNFKSTLKLKDYSAKYVKDYRFVKKILGPKFNFQGQSYCPLNNKKIDKDFFYDFLERRIYACDKGCLEKIKKDPCEAIIKLSSKGQVPLDIPHTK